jgi:aspartyl/asparaginyl beta-hydroxylase (cupin superfamily)
LTVQLWGLSDDSIDASFGQLPRAGQINVVRQHRTPYDASRHGNATRLAKTRQIKQSVA